PPSPGSKRSAVQFAGIPGQRNAYYQVKAVATSEQSYTLEESKTLPAPAKFDDAGRAELRQRPWDAPADGGLLAPFAKDEPWRAFRLRVTGSSPDPDLFTQTGAPVPVIGAQFSATPGGAGLAYKRTGTYAGVESWPPPNPAKGAAVRQK